MELVATTLPILVINSSRAVKKSFINWGMVVMQLSGFVETFKNNAMFQ